MDIFNKPFKKSVDRPRAMLTLQCLHQEAVLPVVACVKLRLIKKSESIAHAFLAFDYTPVIFVSAIFSRKYEFL